jgi:hypothetical protein
VDWDRGGSQNLESESARRIATDETLQVWGGDAGAVSRRTKKHEEKFLSRLLGCTVDYVGGLALYRSWLTTRVWWCRVCVLEAQIEHCQKAVARLPELLAALESAKSVDAVDPSAGIRER